MKLKKNKLYSLTVFATLIAALALPLFIFSGCSDTLEGEVNPNQKPIVSYVNIPPDGQAFSRNPEVYWVGSDNDGLIDYYRYYVARVDDVSGNPIDFANAADPDAWTYINVERTVSDPQTTNIIPLSADIDNPVNNFVNQYIFLQAYDMEGMGSDIVYRILKRNDNPPETQIYSVTAQLPFVNSVFEGGIITGVKLGWIGSDIKDYEEIGLIPPPFQYNWEFYGPFDAVDSAFIYNNFLRFVFVTEDARTFDIGDTLFRCDTSLVDDGGGGTIVVETCDTTVFSLGTPNTPFYVRDTVLNTEDTYFDDKLVTNSTIENNIADGWTYTTGDTLFNVFRNGAPDTTVLLNFLFTVKSRDDAFVEDLTPEFIYFPVINPKYERQVLVLDFSPVRPPNMTSYQRLDTAKAYWYNTISSWLVSEGNDTSNVNFDTSRMFPGTINASAQDYIRVFDYQSGIPISFLLKHKIIVLYSESFMNPGFVISGRVKYPEIFQAMDAGVNIWATWRAPIAGDFSTPGLLNVIIPNLYTHYLGVAGMVFSSWIGYATGIVPNAPEARIEDFVGTYSLDVTKWPDLMIDTDLLHYRLIWDSIFYGDKLKWYDSIAALPEVDWSMRSYGTEVMYLYRSKYGAKHPVSQVLNFDGAPVGHRYQTNLFKSVHFNFTMLTIDSVNGQILANSVLSWLYPADLGVSGADAVSENRYPEASVNIRIEEAREVHKQRLEDN